MHFGWKGFQPLKSRQAGRRNFPEKFWNGKPDGTFLKIVNSALFSRLAAGPLLNGFPIMHQAQ
jgi:hypothetical protein